jgi:hypothetical protein
MYPAATSASDQTATLSTSSKLSQPACAGTIAIIAVAPPLTLIVAEVQTVLSAVTPPAFLRNEQFRI